MSSDRRYHYFVLLLLIVILAAAVRLFALNAQSLWSDELFEAVHAKDLLSILSVNDSKFRLVLVHLFMLFGESEFFIRFTSASAGILGVALMYLLGKELFGKETGIIGAFLMATNAFHIAYSQEARSYALTVLYTLTSLYCLLRALRTNQWKYWAGFAVFSALGLDNNVITGIAFASEITFAFLTLLFARLIGSTHRTSPVWGQLLGLRRSETVLTRAQVVSILRRVTCTKETRFILSVLSGALLFLPSGIGWFSHLRSAGVRVTSSSVGDSSFVALHLSGDFLIRLLAAFGAGDGAAMYIFVSAFVVGLASMVIMKNWTRLLLIILWILLPLIVLEFIGTSESRFHIRHIIFVLPIYLLVVASGVVAISRCVSSWAETRKPSARFATHWFALTLAVVLFGLLGTVSIQAYYAEQKEDWRGVSAFLDEHAKSGDLVYQLSLWPRDGIEYYVGESFSRKAIRFSTVYDTAKVSGGELRGSIWWVVRTEDFQGPLHPEKAEELRNLLGSGFSVFPFARIALIQGPDRQLTLNDFLHLGSALLSKEQEFDAEEVQISYAWAWFALGSADYAAGNLGRAADSFVRGIEAKPNEDTGYMLLANVRLKQNQFDEALHLYDKAMQVNPADGRPRMMRWRVLRRLGDEEKAKAEIQQVVTRLGPKWIELVAWQLSQFQWEYGAAEDVVGLLQETQGIVPESGKIHLYLSMAYLKEADAAGEERLLHLGLAQSELEKAERLLPRDPEVLTVRVKLGQMQQSLP